MKEPTPHRRLSWPAALTLVVLFLSLLGGFALYRLELMPMHTARQVREAFGEFAHLQPKITIGDRVYFEQTASALELATVTRETHVERDVEHAWLGSTKRLQLRGDYLVRAGFDLRQPFTVRISGKRIQVEAPPPRILSVDQTSLEALHFDNGLWNKFSPTEVVEETRELPLLARAKATEAGLQNEALEKFAEELRSKLGPEYEVQVSGPAPAAFVPR